MSSKIKQMDDYRVIRTLPELNNQSKQTFRQGRLDNSEGFLTLTIGKANCRLLNWSRTGLGFEASYPDSFPVGLKVGPVKIHAGEIEVYNGDIEIKSVRKVNETLSIVGAEFKSRLFLVEGIEAALGVSRVSSELTSAHEQMQEVNPEVCKLIIEMGSSLNRLKAFCDEQERSLAQMTLDCRTEATNILLPSLSKEVKKLFGNYNRKLAALLDIEQIPEDSTYHRLFEENIYPYFKSADLTRRAFEKPRGYAGDFEMMNAMYRNGYEGTDLIGKVLHNYTANEDSSESVQYRKPYFISLIEETMDHPGPKSFLSIACGPAIEVQELVNRWPQQKLDEARFTLFDLDRMALEHAQSKIFQNSINQNKTPNISFVNASVKSFLTHTTDAGSDFDLIYSGGLFDYLDNPTSKALVHKFFALLKPKGRLVIGNFTKNNTTKAFCHLITRWHLIHKTPEEMHGWCEGLPAGKVRMDFDPHGINAFLVIHKG
ncbi:MAG: class I SAM-dependent methyltransferase [Deltaproteobacteria bacterium]|nr:class I SAM-dependent methyltransferase [Deltaproteobacteria bacterium]